MLYFPKLDVFLLRLKDYILPLDRIALYMLKNITTHFLKICCQQDCLNHVEKVSILMYFDARKQINNIYYDHRLSKQKIDSRKPLMAHTKFYMFVFCLMCCNQIRLFKINLDLLTITHLTLDLSILFELSSVELNRHMKHDFVFVVCFFQVTL